MLKITRKDNGFVAIIRLASSDTDEALGPMSEHELRQKLFESGFAQRDIEEAFLAADPKYFGVGKW